MLEGNSEKNLLTWHHLAPGVVSNDCRQCGLSQQLGVGGWGQWEEVEGYHHPAGRDHLQCTPQRPHKASSEIPRTQHGGSGALSSLIFKIVVSRKLISDTQRIMYVSFTLAIFDALSPTRISAYRRITTESLVVIQQAIHLHFLSFIPLASTTVFMLIIPSSVTWSQSLSQASCTGQGASSLCHIQS